MTKTADELRTLKGCRAFKLLFAAGKIMQTRFSHVSSYELVDLVALFNNLMVPRLGAPMLQTVHLYDDLRFILGDEYFWKLPFTSGSVLEVTSRAPGGQQ